MKRTAAPVVVVAVVARLLLDLWLVGVVRPTQPIPLGDCGPVGPGAKRPLAKRPLAKRPFAM